MKLFNKWVGIIFCIFSFFSLSQATTNAPAINQERINQAKQAIAKEFIINKALRYTIMAGGAAGAAFIVYQTWNKFYSVHSTYDAQAVAPSLGSWQWCERVLRITRDALISTALTKGIVSSGESMMEQLFHEGDIQWFIKSHTHLVETLKQLKQFAQVIDNQEQCSSAQITYVKTSLLITMRSFIIQMERLLGFINYKMERIDIKSDTVHSIREIPVYLTELCEQLSHAYELKTAGSPIKFADRVLYFENELTNLISRFAHLDEDIKWINQTTDHL